jgi:hypothetical protein
MALKIYETTERHIARNVLVFIVIAAIVAGAGYFGYRWYTSGEPLPVPLAIAQVSSGVDESPVSDAQVESHTVDSTVPKYMSIGALNTGNLRIFAVGFDGNAVLGLPSNMHDIGWYDKSAVPGTGGVIVMNAYGEVNSSDAPLIDALTLASGDRIVLTTGNDKTYDYTVQDVTEVDIDTFNSDTTKSLGTSYVESDEGLNIIVQSGVWIPQINTYSDRIVIRATAVDSL